MHLVCPKCQGVNRVQAEKKTQNPVCGKCRAALLPGKPIELKAQTFSKFINRSELSVVVDFWAPWCGPCTMMAPAYEQAAAALQQEALLAKVNTQDNQDLAARFQIQSIPTLVCFANGREKARQSGAMNKDGLVNWIRSLRIED